MNLLAVFQLKRLELFHGRLLILDIDLLHDHLAVGPDELLLLLHPGGDVHPDKVLLLLNHFWLLLNHLIVLLLHLQLLQHHHLLLILRLRHLLNADVVQRLLLHRRLHRVVRVADALVRLPLLRWLEGDL